MKKLFILFTICLPLAVFILSFIQYSNDDVYNINKKIDPEKNLNLFYSNEDLQYVLRYKETYYAKTSYFSIQQTEKQPIQIGTDYNSLYKMEFLDGELNLTFQELQNEYPNYNYNLDYKGGQLFAANEDFFKVETTGNYEITYVGDSIYYYDFSNLYLISTTESVQNIDVNEMIEGYDYTYKYVFVDNFKNMVFTNDYIFESNEDGVFTNLKTGEEISVVKSNNSEFVYYDSISYDYDDNTLIIIYSVQDNELDISRHALIYDLDKDEYVIVDPNPSIDYYLLNYEGSVYEQ